MLHPRSVLALAFAGLLAGSLATAQTGTYQVVPDESRANYRITEQLARIPSPVDAVGVTQDVEGVVHLDEQGNVLPDSRIRVGLASLESDQARRDGFVGRNVLATDRFPDAVLVPTGILGLDLPLPETGSASFEIVGDLTVRDVTRSTVWRAEATFDGDVVRVEAATAFTFEEFGLERPIVGMVLSVANDIRLEASLLLQRTE